MDVVVNEVVDGFGVLVVAVHAPVEHAEEEDEEGADGDAAYQGGLINHHEWLGALEERVGIFGLSIFVGNDLLPFRAS